MPARLWWVAVYLTHQGLKDKIFKNSFVFPEDWRLAAGDCF